MSKTPREIVVSNGRVLVALDNKMRIRDFFYPNVGLENHVDGHSFKVGIWTDNMFSWIDENWDHALLIWEKDKSLLDFCRKENQKYYVFPLNPTAEAMSKYLFEQIDGSKITRENKVKIKSITIYETDTSYATYGE